jgi:hypothetical protein
MGGTAVRQVLEQAREKMGLPKAECPHTLQHFWAVLIVTLPQKCKLPA